MRDHASRIEMSVATETAKATVPWLTTKNTTTIRAKAVKLTRTASEPTYPPKVVYSSPPNPTNSMYCAALNVARTSALRRTTKCATNPVTPAMTIGQGGANKSTEAKNGMNTTEEPTYA